MHVIAGDEVEKSSAVSDIYEPYEIQDQSTGLYVPTYASVALLLWW